MRYTCPVCMYPYLVEPPRSQKTGSGSYEICASCGFEFGVTDDDKGFSYEDWRKIWIDKGMPWRDQGISEKPPDWNPAESLRKVKPN
jgi:hypothetical protein